ncbi:Imm51 family immunity protein [Hymenobacter psychrotolerans]|uniref:Immunity protein 51 n=1 Tax=Hymenobacter psychrotolerans DSM 18569 TaxID=1121959 RepID=A0A1M7FB85_9BACT|nr:Imm51 family immunity protein [Hymenobacter psychrotolerans]SHM00979.1 Immunity protein 51 [Hymenobacter psychrotolerans DSM 18569]
MSSTFPFIVSDLPEPTPEHQQRILVNLSEMDDYYNVFEKYGYSGNGASWAEHIETILEEYAPELLDHLEMAGEGEVFLVFTDGPATTAQFLRLIQPIFGDLGSLNKYLSQADPGDFFE